MKIFLVGGKAGSGKSEVAKYIKEYYIYKIESCVITEYSKYLKRFAIELTDWDGNSNTKPRTYLQELGDKIRNLNSKYFINNMIEDLRIYKTLTENVVVSDVRYPDEIEDIKLNFDDVYAIYVENQFSKSNLTLEEQSHRSETALEDYPEFDYVLANDKMEDLKDKVFKFLEGLE